MTGNLDGPMRILLCLILAVLFMGCEQPEIELSPTPNVLESYRIEDRESLSSEQSLTDVKERVKQSVVLVHPIRKGYSSGFVIDSEGLIVTNHHVIENGGGVAVEFGEDCWEEYRLEEDCWHVVDIVGEYPNLDLAFLQIIGEGEFPYLDIRDSNEVSVGEPVFIWGYPNETLTLSKGKITNVSVHEIETNVNINPGNSGSPLFDEEGNVIGVMKQKDTQTGKSYAVSSKYILGYLEEVSQTSHHPLIRQESA